VDLATFTALAHRLVDEVPPELCQDLSGGFLVSPEALWDGRYAILGQYIQDNLGSRVVFYYGSFAAVLNDAPPDTWEAELRETVFHEMRHHVERLCGSDELAEEETRARAREDRGALRRRRIPAGGGLRRRGASSDGREGEP